MSLSYLRIETRDQIVYATIGGDIDMSNVQQIRDEVGRATTNQALGLVLDLAAVDYLDSAGIHLIHSLRSHLRSHGQKIALIIPKGSVINDTLRLAGLEWEDLRIASADEAPQTFAGPGTLGPAADEETAEVASEEAAQPAPAEIQAVPGETAPAAAAEAAQPTSAGD